ncbi:MAG: conjugal transfer protein TraH [Neisseriaceae bacterium]|nr:conjugal transfer protein TraH [Neisseriaceae bacterium]
MKIKQKIKPLVIMVALSLSVASANARNSLENAMDNMLGLDNVQTSKGYFSKNGVNGAYSASFGGFSTRSPIRKISVFAWDAPKFSAGCGGIDAQFGSFSLISKDQIEQVVKAVMSSAKGYAVKLAINKICPDCLGVLNNLEAKATGLSSSMKNTCEISAAGVDWLATAVGLNETTTSIKNDHKSDYGKAKEDQAKGNQNRNQTGNTADDWAQYGNSLLNTMVSAGVFKDTNSDTGFNTKVYGTDQQFFEIAMSLVGTTIVHTDDPTKSNEEIEAIWSFDDFTQGTRPNHQQHMLKCKTALDVTNVSSCQSVITDESKWVGTYKYILEILLGEQDKDNYKNGIFTIKDDSVIAYLREIGKTNNNGQNKVSGFRKAFVSNSAVLDNTAYRILYDAANQENEQLAIDIAQIIANVSAEQMSAELVQSLVRMVVVAYNNNVPKANGKDSKKKAVLTPDQKKRLDTLKAQADQVQKRKSEDFAKVAAQYELMKKLTPKQAAVSYSAQSQ